MFSVLLGLKKKKLCLIQPWTFPGSSPLQHAVHILTGKIYLLLFPPRSSLMGFDLNRHWQDPSPWAQPTLYAVKQLIVQMSQDPVSTLTHTHGRERICTVNIFYL